MEKATELIFVYNADTGLANSLLDSLHKTLSPSTYSCHLCQITYGTVSMKREWKKFLEDLPIKTTFLYRNEWKLTQLGDRELPAIFLSENGKLTEWMAADELKKMSLPGLMERISISFKK